MPRALRLFIRVVVLLTLFVGIGNLAACSRKQTPAAIDRPALFTKKCASCHHDGNDMRAPGAEALRQMSRSSILAALDSGNMKWQAKFLTKIQKIALAEYLGKPDVHLPVETANFCGRDLDPPPDPPRWSGWGVNPQNTRFQPAWTAGLDRERVKDLKLKWAFGFPGAAATFSQPTSFAGRLFVGSEDGTVYSLDAASGCTWWTFRASATVKTAISVGNQGRTAFFGDTNGFVYAVNVSDGALTWKIHPDPHPAARITGSPLLVSTRLYVPISSGEEGAAADPRYPCCTFRGSIVAVDTTSGKQIWKTHTIDEAPRPTRKTPDGVQEWGPSGAAVWSAPTADVKRHTLYVATGNNYSFPPTETSDAVLALDMKSGKKLWHRQLTPKDLWNSGCVAEQKENCPDHRGDDFDFGSPPVLKSLPQGRDILLLSQKSGFVYALDPGNRGKLLWKTRIGHGGSLGGIQWGGAVDNRRAYYPLSDYDDANPLAGGGLFALKLQTGKQAWHALPPKPKCSKEFGCSAAQMAPPTAIPGVVFAGSLDGHLRAYDARDGSVIWDFDTAQEFHTINGIMGHGGSMNGSGPTVVDGMVYVNTGYTNAMAGNVLLAFSIDSK